MIPAVVLLLFLGGGNGSNVVVVGITSLLTFILSLWTGVISIRALAEVHRIGSWRMVGGMLILMLLVVATMLGVFAIIGLLIFGLGRQ